MYFIHSERAFDGLLQLLTLNLSMNAIKHIPINAFVGLVSLQQMDLSHNLIEKLDNKTNGALDNCLSLRKVIKQIHCFINQTDIGVHFVADKLES